MRPLRPLLITLASLALPAGASHARAADGPGVQECIAANEKSGPLRQQGKLREARAQLRLCAAPTCPAVVRDDCVSGATRLDSAVPSVVLAVQDAAGADVLAVVVTMDGEPLAERLEGKPIEVDPGSHLFRFEAPGQPAVERRLVILEGEKDRRERVVLGAPAAPAPAPPASSVPAGPAPPPQATGGSSGSLRTVGLVVGGVGLVGLGVGAVTGAMTFASWSSAKSACGPAFPGSCRDPGQASGDRSSALTTGAVSTAAFVGGGLALATGAVLFLMGGSQAPSQDQVTLTPAAGPQGAGLQVRGTFR